VRFFYNYLAKLLLKSNRAARYPGAGQGIDLSTARNNKSLGLKGLSLTIVSKGDADATWSFRFKFADGTTCAFNNDEVNEGDYWELEFEDIEFTNSAQAGKTGPSFYYSWRA